MAARRTRGPAAVTPASDPSSLEGRSPAPVTSNATNRRGSVIGPPHAEITILPWRALRLARVAALAAAAALGGAGAQAQQTPRDTLRAGRGAARLQVDGLLDEPEWIAADSIGNLTQVEPTEGGPPTGRTVIRVLADPGTIVIGIVSHLGPDSAVVSFSKDRDADLEEEDHVRLVLDTFRDQRSGYLFSVNPTGARYDALITNQGEGENSNWDALWEAATAMSDGAWTAEIRIPIKSLAYRSGLTSWGLNVERRIQGRQETNRWSGPRRDQMFGQTGNAGLLVGLPAFDPGVGLTVRPSVTAGGGRPAPGEAIDGTVDPSLDVRQRLGSNLLASVTLNTDFAETEVDTRQTNLTRFPLFFPEKRTFFLEGSDLFEFGLGLRTDLMPFFSRRIGLLEGREIPLRAGGKLDGQIGETRVAGLVTRTGRLDSLATATTLAAVRVRRNVLRESSVGAIATFGDPVGRGTSWLAGVDAVYRTSRFRGDKSFLVGAWLLGMDRAGTTGSRLAFGAKIDYPNDLWDVALTWKRIGDGFDPALGFVPRRGIHQFNLGANFMPRPGRFGIRQIFLENQLSLVTDLTGRWESYRWFTAPINWRLESGDRLEVNVVPQGERLIEGFEVADGVTIARGTYRFTRYRLELETAARRRLSGQVTWWFGGFYRGHLHQLELEADWKPSATFSLGLAADHAIGRLPEGSFTETVVGARLRVSISPDLQIHSFIQYDSEDRSIGANTRLRWTIRPVAELFLVYNHNVRDRMSRWEFESNQLLAKFQYALQY